MEHYRVKYLYEACEKNEIEEVNWITKDEDNILVKTATEKKKKKKKKFDNSNWNVDD